MKRLIFFLCVLVSSSACSKSGAPLAPVRASIATGPLRVNPANSRYFTDGTGKAVYLAGSHTWSNLLDRGTLQQNPVAFDYDAYIRWMVARNFNFMRLWTAELPNALADSNGDPYENFVAAPYKWARTGPGNADDGGLKFDLTKFDPKYFDRVRSRVITARDNGIYVAVMLFEGEEWQHETHPGDGNAFLGSNNVNAVNCPASCPTDTSLMPKGVWEYEKAYIRRVVDTVNDLDNVLYEVSNEAGAPYSNSWQASVIAFVRQYEATKPKQHPIGMTFQYMGGLDSTLYQSAADWISPSARFPNGDGSKVVINDTDHAFPWRDLKNDGVEGQRAWVWKNFTSGNNVAFMDPYLVVWPRRNSPGGSTADPHIGVRPDKYWESMRNAMGSTLTYANRMNLAAMTPQRSLSSTGYCLGNSGVEYLVYQPVAGSFTLKLMPGTYSYEWLNPASNRIEISGKISVATTDTPWKPPFKGDSVLYLRVVPIR